MIQSRQPAHHFIPDLHTAGVPHPFRVADDSWHWDFHFDAKCQVASTDHVLRIPAMCAHRALHTGHGPAAWFVIGLLLNVLGYLLLLTRPKREVQALAGVPAGLHKVAATYAPEPCPGCGTLNHPSASACIGCGGKLQPKTVSEVARAGLRTA